MQLRVLTLSIFMAAFALTMQACSRPLAPQESCNFVQNPEQQRVSWDRHVPVKMVLHKSVPPEAYAAIDRAIAELNFKLRKDVIKIVDRGVGGELNPQKDGTSMIYWFDRWDANHSEQARTTIYWQGAEIFEADMRINADPADFSYHEGEDSNFTNVDLQSLVLHEFGHVLGLAHNVTSGSVMNLTLNNGQDRRKLSDEDLASLKCEY